MRTRKENKEFGKRANDGVNLWVHFVDPGFQSLGFFAVSCSFPVALRESAFGHGLVQLLSQFPVSSPCRMLSLNTSCDVLNGM